MSQTGGSVKTGREEVDWTETQSWQSNGRIGWRGLEMDQNKETHKIYKEKWQWVGMEIQVLMMAGVVEWDRRAQAYI